MDILWMLKTRMHDFIMAEDWELLDVIYDRTFVPMKTIGKIILRNKLVRKILSVVPSSWESKVNAITKAKDLQKPTIDELIENLKTYEMKKKDHERREPKKEKNLVLKVDNNDSSGDDVDIAYLTQRKPGHFIEYYPLYKHENYKYNSNKMAKRNLVPDRKFKRKDATNNVRKQALAAWRDSFSESEGDDEQGDTFMMTIKSEAGKYDSIFALMEKFDEDEDDDDDEKSKVFVEKISTAKEPGSLKRKLKGSNQRWYMDSDCSKHMTGSTEDFLSLKSLQGGSVSFGNDKKGYILGVGNIRKTLTHSNENVYYMNGLKYNLLSVSQICDKGNKVDFLLKSCTITNLVIGEVVLVAKRFKNIYVADFESLSSGDPTCLSDVAELWYRRLGHAIFSLLNKLIKKDLMPSRGGKKYIFVIVDDYYRFTWTLFLKTKDETFPVFAAFVK
ncbi:uncharacterized protein [Nicotiana sylvestris]|uniref:uncharacterized protein n=1 Tax=Nicotiana sylvestris TaxID=4096 RepID=UPI00388CBCF0